jgi:hypothetical protein
MGAQSDNPAYPNNTIYYLVEKGGGESASAVKTNTVLRPILRVKDLLVVQQ